MYLRMISLSDVRDKIEVRLIGRNSAGTFGMVVLGTEILVAVFHCVGTMFVSGDLLKSIVIGKDS